MKRERFEALIRQALNRIGFDLRRYHPRSTESGRLAAMLAAHDVDLVIDVGANEGQFGQGLRAAGYAGRMLSIEPLPDANARLMRAAAGDPEWEVAPPVALGAREGRIEIHVAGNSVSSSALPMLDSHLRAAPESGSVGVVDARLTTLDLLLRQRSCDSARPFLKVDTQGFEEQVLDGAVELVPRLAGLQLELSLVPLYEGQRLYDFMLGRLQSAGFTIWAIRPGMCDPDSGRMLQVDVALFRD